MGKRVDLTGKTIGGWYIAKHVGQNKHRQSVYLCWCKCGAERLRIHTNIVTKLRANKGCDDCIVWAQNPKSLANLRNRPKSSA